MLRFTIKSIVFTSAVLVAVMSGQADAGNNQNWGKGHWGHHGHQNYHNNHRPSVTMPHSVAGNHGYHGHHSNYRPNYRPITSPVHRYPSRPSVTMPHATAGRYYGGNRSYHFQGRNYFSSGRKSR